jgi:hypothetical protein
MKIDELFTLTTLVEDILIKYPQTRNSDSILYIKVVGYIYPQALSMPFDHVLYSLKDLGLPTIESVGRCRRKLQAEKPELWSDKQVQKYREENEKTFENYARS